MFRFLAATALVLACHVAAADDESTAPPAAFPIANLRDADDRLNASYAQARMALDEEQSRLLVAEQRAWLKDRDQRCGFRSKESDRERWLEALASRPDAANCVVDTIERRIGHLRARVAASSILYSGTDGSWGQVLNPSGEVPDDAFKVFYLDMRHPRTPISTAIVPDIALQSSYGVSSAPFGGYWVGRVTYDAPTPRMIRIAQGAANTRLLIDGTVVYAGMREAEVPFTFAPGPHVVEVEHQDQGQTTPFLVDLDGDPRAVPPNELAPLLAQARARNARLLFVGLYDSGPSSSTQVRLLPSDEPVVLVLSSFAAIRWEIRNPDGVELLAVIYGSTETGSLVRGDVAGAQRIRTTRPIGSYVLASGCKKATETPACRRYGPDSAVAGLYRMTGLPLAGTSTRYAANRLLVPEKLFAPGLIGD